MNVTVLIPRVRRAIDGPAASSSAAPSTTLDDGAVGALIADAIAEVIFYTGGRFPHTLDVEDRDDNYGAPTEWSVNPDLTEPETAVIAAQAALSYFFFSLRSLKTSETIRDEGQEWTYSLSANLIRDQMAYLRALRDAALAQVEEEQQVALEAYTSFIAVRDRQAAAFIEPWVDGLAIGGLENVR